MYYSKRQYKLIGFEKSKRKNKKYNAIIENKQTNKQIRIPFGSIFHENYHDKTGLNLYPNLLHHDKDRRKRYQARAKNKLKPGYYSASWFAFSYLW